MFAGQCWARNEWPLKPVSGASKNFVTNLQKIIVHVNVLKKTRNSVYFVKCSLAFLTCTGFDMPRQAEEKQKLK